MKDSITNTFELLAATQNEAAVRVLTAALDSRFARLRNHAIDAILSRRNSSGHGALLRRLHLLGEDCRNRIKQHRAQLSHALRDVILGNDPQSCANGCQAVLWFREYDLIPALINAVTDRGNPHAEMVGQTLLKLVDSLYERLATPQRDRPPRDPNIIRQHTITALESAVERFSQHHRREVIEAFLILTACDNIVLKQILSDSRHPAFVVMIETLSRSERSGVIRLLLALLDDPGTPSAALSVIGNRRDPRFLHFLLTKIADRTSRAAAANLKRIESIGWLRNPAAIFGKLDGAEQCGLVKLVRQAGVSRDSAFGLITYVLQHGLAEGRRAAAEALGEFNGMEANRLVLSCLEDGDPQVQASAVAQLRSRGIPGTLARLAEMLDSPHAAVRRCARESLSEFSFQRFLAAFEMLDDEVRHRMALLVKKVDTRAMELLAEEMKSPLRTRRLRALAMAEAMAVVEPLQANIIAMLDDEDHRVRVEAATLLARATSTAAQHALQRSLHDSSPAVREAAQASLASSHHEVISASGGGGS